MRRAVVLTAVLAAAAAATAADAVSGERKVWHKVTLTFTGPATSEKADPNPFLDYRLTATFTHDGVSREVCGYYAADGNAGETSADAGGTWRVHFVPDSPGEWAWKVSFRMGKDVAISDDADAGKPAAFDGQSGTFQVAPTDKAAPDPRARGVLRYAGKRYLRFAGTGEYYLKGGADSPENFLGYADFDQTPPRHRYQPHVADWKAGDPTWKGGKGKGIIGALNYLAGKGMNSVYFLTMNVRGDGKDVWPWTAQDEPLRFDCSKCDQWEVVFSHMDRLGIALHVVTQETENDQLLDGGNLGRQRKLYYRELIARFGHHLAVVWNLGEENTNTHAQRQEFARYIHRLDPYGHAVVVHTYPSNRDRVYAPLLGYEFLEGPSLQLSRVGETHAETIKWVDRSAAAKRPWVVCLDEFGPANFGAAPDAVDPAHDEIRRQGLWGNLMAGGGGVEWYFGYRHPHGDLNCEDWRSRDRLWDQTRHALEFFRKHLPFAEMSHADDLTGGAGDYVLARPGEVYAVYLPAGGSAELKLPEGAYDVRWYNPRAGGELQAGAVRRVTGPGLSPIGQPPAEVDKDWAALVRRAAGN